MAAAKGTKPPNAGKGRKAGVPNKITATLKDMILQSLSNVGGSAYLERQAVKQPAAYMALIGRVLPLQVKQDGDDPRVPAAVIHQHVALEAAQVPPVALIHLSAPADESAESLG